MAVQWHTAHVFSVQPVPVRPVHATRLCSNYPLLAIKLVPRLCTFVTELCRIADVSGKRWSYLRIVATAGAPFRVVIAARRHCASATALASINCQEINVLYTYILVAFHVTGPRPVRGITSMRQASRLSWTGDLDSLNSNAARSIFPAHAWNRSTIRQDEMSTKSPNLEWRR